MIKIDTKKCKQCEEVKSIDDFYKQNKVNAKGEKYIYYNPECKECTKKRTMQWEKDNPEETKELRRKWARDPKNNKARKYYNKLMRERGTLKKWQHNNKEKLRQYNENRRNKNHDISKEEWEQCKIYFDNSCAYCGISYKEHKEKYQQDLHKEHVDHKGANDLSNCVPACKICNSEKHTSILGDWYNENNPNYSVERINKIHKWLNSEYINYTKVGDSNR